MKLYMPVLPDGRDLGILVKANTPDNSVIKANTWLKQLGKQEREYFTGTEYFWACDAVPVNKNDMDIII